MPREKLITDWDQVPELFDIPYAMRLYGINQVTMYSLCKSGELPAFKVGKLWRFRKSDVMADLDSRVGRKGA